MNGLNVVRWNPLRELDQVFDRYLMPATAANGHDWRPLVDIHETDEGYRVDLELPAVKPEDVSVTLHDGVLRVSGERRVANDDSGRVHRSERYFGKFERSFRLPEDVDAEAIKATAKDGVVSIVVAKSEKASPRAIEVQSV
ncbi:MAG: Hsp20/alpha crystallin family protein [Gammaproteobacteria bacterium]|nr:Hsp20/alpha crystallin family protein [Gammaproteobacteria bacterium]